MCLVSIKEDLDYSDPARLRRVSRSRTYPTGPDGVQRITQRRILEERSPSGNISPVRPTSTRPTLPASKVYTNQSRKPSVAKPVSRCHYNSEGTEGGQWHSKTGPNDMSDDQRATGIETTESQSKHASRGAGVGTNDLSQYIEVEFYSTSSSSSSCDSSEDARAQIANKTGSVYGYPRSTTTAQVSNHSRDRSQNSKGEFVDDRASRGRYGVDRRKVAVDYTYRRRHRE